MPDLIVYPATGPLTGSVPVPSDKSITHRAIMLAAIAAGKSRVRATAMGEDNHSTLGAIRALGIASSEPSPGELIIEGTGLYGLRAPSAPIDCGNSGTTMRLLPGILAAQRFATRLIGDASLSRRPMERIARPLRLRGARIEGVIDPRRTGEITPPLDIGPLPQPHVLGPLEYEMPIASAQVKSSILLSALYADGPTYIREPLVSRDHTERMLAALGAPIRTIGAMVAFDPEAWNPELPAFDMTIPGDPSAAAFLITAAQLVDKSRVTTRGVGLNTTRTGLLDVLRDMGAALAVEPTGDALGEPVGHVHAESADLKAGRLGGELVPRAIDEVPIFCALAARARGESHVFDAAELRVKESDRLAVMARVLGAFGVACEEQPDGIIIQGAPDRPLQAADVDSGGDHRVAMTAAILGLLADGPSRVRDVACIATSFPRFVGTLRALGAKIDVVQGEGEA